MEAHAACLCPPVDRGGFSRRPSENEPSVIHVHRLDTAQGLDSGRILVQIGLETFHIWSVQEGRSEGFLRFEDPLWRLTKTILLDDDTLVGVVDVGIHGHRCRIYHRQQDPNGVRLAGWERMPYDDTGFHLFDMVHAKWTGDQGESRDELVYAAANTFGAVQEHGVPNVLTVGWVDKTNGRRNEIFRVDISSNGFLYGQMGLSVCNKEWLIINTKDDCMLYNLRTGSFRSQIDDRIVYHELVSNPVTNVLYTLKTGPKGHVQCFKVDEDGQFSLHSAFNLDSPPRRYRNSPRFHRLLHVDFQTDTLTTRSTGGVFFFDGVTGTLLHRVTIARPIHSELDLSIVSVAVLAGKGLYAVSENNDGLPKLYLLPSAK